MKLKQLSFTALLLLTPAFANRRKATRDTYMYDLMREQEERMHIEHIDSPKIITSAKDFFKSDYFNDIILFPQYHDNLDTISASFLSDADANHELGHYYMDKRSEQIGLGNFPNFTTAWDDEYFCKRLIGEGVGRYFEREMMRRQNPFQEITWPTSQEIRNMQLLYETGYQLVYPILKNDVRKGVDYLLKNPPKPEDLADLGAYQKKALEDLDYF